MRISNLKYFKLQIKAALTRAYNKEGKANPYATTVSVKKVTSAADTEFGEDENEEGDVEETEDNLDLDAMIKVKSIN